MSNTGESTTVLIIRTERPLENINKIKKDSKRAKRCDEKRSAVNEGQALFAEMQLYNAILWLFLDEHSIILLLLFLHYILYLLYA